jgi:hypothetical protein
MLRTRWHLFGNALFLSAIAPATRLGAAVPFPNRFRLPAFYELHVWGGVTIRMEPSRTGILASRVTGSERDHATPRHIATIAVWALRPRLSGLRDRSGTDAMSAQTYRDSEQVDFVIVGSGASGGVIARELSRAGLSVVLPGTGAEVLPDGFQARRAQGLVPRRHHQRCRQESADVPE